MTHDEIEELLGAYALDALDADERQEVEDHLATCPRCRAEVAAHREVTALLGNAAGDVAAGRARRPVGPDLRLAPGRAACPRPGGATRRAGEGMPSSCRSAAVAAALILIVGLLAAKVGNLDQQVKGLSTRSSVGSGDPQSVTHDGAAHVRDRELARPRSSCCPTARAISSTRPCRRFGRSQTFQLWALSRGKVVSLGVLGSQPDGAAIRVEPTMTVLMITAEPLGGTPAPTTPVLVRGNLPVGL